MTFTLANIAELSKRHILKVLCLSLFLLAQSLTISHATEHGDHPHEHDGVVCEVTLIGADIEQITPPIPVIYGVEPHIEDRCDDENTALTYVKLHFFSPPGRGPPLL